MKFLKYLILTLLLCGAAWANTINAANCTSAAVLAAIASASNGDTVAVPAGNCTWNTPSANTPVINLTKSITVQGTTTCSGSPVTCVDSTIINDNTGNGFDENLIDDNANNSRITGFSFRDSRNLADAKPPVQLSCNSCRFDHNSMTQNNTGGPPHGVYVYSSVTGYQLVDNNYFKDLNGAADVDGSANDAHFPGDQSWANTLTLGSANAAYIEHNNFDFTPGTVLDGAYDSYAGARLVFRYNTVASTNFGGHGLDSGGLRSTLLQEVYNNTVTNSGTHVYTMMGTRGGTHMIFNNTVSASGGSYDAFLWLQEYRSSSGYSWGTPTGALCGGSPTNAIDSNTSHGWICRDQVGRGPETAPANDFPAKAAPPYTFSEASFPGYEWNNTFKGSAPTTANINVCDAVPNCSTSNATLFQVLNNRDFYMEVPSFDGTAGTGSGLLSARPATCTPKVAYWATDTNTLYQCSSTNTWSVYYRPFQYPYLSGTPTASTPTFSPGAGTYSNPQNVTISTTSGSVICWNTTGSPATNGSTGCAVGTLYTGPVTVSVSETLFAVAGGTGFLDSSVGSAAYVIAPAAPTNLQVVVH